MRKGYITFLAVVLFSACTTPPPANLSFKAALSSDLGRAKPVAHQRFYLLNEDLDEIVDDAGDGSLSKRELGDVEEWVKKDIVATATTDSEGKGEFGNVPLGDYFIVGFFPVREGREFAVWTLPVKVKSINQSLLLSQTNGFLGEYYSTKRLNEKRQRFAEAQIKAESDAAKEAERQERSDRYWGR